MKIAYITVNIPYGSAESFLTAEIREIIRQGNQLAIVPRSPLNYFGQEAAAFLNITLKESLFSFKVFIGSVNAFVHQPLKSLKCLLVLFRSRDAKVLLKNLLVFPKGLWLSRMVLESDAAHIHAHWATTTATIAMIASELSGIPWSFTAHRGDIAENNLLREKVQSASFVRFISRDGLRMAQLHGIKGSEHKTHVVHMGVEVPETPGNCSEIRPERVIMCPANLLPVKGHRYLLEALEMLSRRKFECSLIIAGQGNLLDGLKALAKRLRIEHLVKFVGQVPHDELIQLYRENKVGAVVVPSVDLGHGEHEGIPVSLIEAMSFGIPVISTATGGIPELLGNGAGILVPQKDPDALAEAIHSIFLDVDLRSRLIRAGRARVNEEFEIRGVVSEILSLMNGCGSR